jgi:hypothetical protein
MKTELIEYHRAQARHWRKTLHQTPVYNATAESQALFHERTVAWLESLDRPLEPKVKPPEIANVAIQ